MFNPIVEFVNEGLWMFCIVCQLFAIHILFSWLVKIVKIFKCNISIKNTAFRQLVPLILWMAMEVGGFGKVKKLLGH